MNKKLSIGIALASPILALGACQGGFDDGADHDLAGERGVLVSESAEGATVCVDKNTSFVCEAGEPSTVAAADGSYDLDTLFKDGASYEEATVIAVLKAKDGDVDKASTTLAAAPGRPELISGATNLMYHLTTGKDAISADEAWSRVKEEFGLESKLSLTAEEHAPGSRLGRLAGILENQVVASGETAKTAAEHQVAIRSVLSSAGQIGSLLDVLEAPAALPTTVHALALSQPEGPTQSDPYTNMAATQGMRFGAGWNDVQSSVLGNTQCLEPYTITSNNAFFQDFNTVRIRDKHDLAEQLGISGKVALDLGAFNATIEGTFFNQMQMNENYVYILAKNEVRLRDFHIVNATMALDGYGNCAEGLEDAEGRCPDGKLNNGQGQRVGTVREKFTRSGDDAEAFRVKCGDRYIDTITTGGAYYGLLTIKTSSQDEKEKLSAALDAKLKESLEVDGQLESVFNELKQLENVEVRIMQRGVGSGSTLVLTPEQFDADLQAWKNNVCAVHGPGSCSFQEAPVDPNDWTKAPFRVKWADYAPTANTPRGGDFAAHAAAMDVYVWLTNEYRAARASIENMLAFSLFYEGAVGREQELQDRIADINSQLGMVRALYNGCNQQIGRICPNLNADEAKVAAGLTPPQLLDKANPAKGWNLDLPKPKARKPRTCAQFKQYYPTVTETFGDINYTLYINGNGAMPFFAYCDGMDTSAPQEYLTLERYSGAGHDAQDNFSQFSQYPDTNGVPQKLTTAYDRLKVLVNANGLKVDVVNQTKFRTTTGGPVVDPQTQEPYLYAPYATAKSCSSEVAGRANINLTGTPFVLNPEIGFGIPDTQMELVTQPKTWYAAKADAELRGGRLAVVNNESENTSLLEKLELANYVEAWLGLRATTTAPRAFVWADGESSYGNFADPGINAWLNTPAQARIDYCAITTSPDGKWMPAPCRTATRPYFVQYRKTVGEGLEGAQGLDLNGEPVARQVFNMTVRSQLGCGSVTPSVQLALDYVPNVFDANQEPSH